MRSRETKRWSGTRRMAAALLVLATMTAVRAARAQGQFMKPTPEELAMTSLPGYPGVAAVVLYDQEITSDDMHMVQHYERIKILTEDGKKYANVQLNYVSTKDTGNASFNNGDDKTVDSIVGRTIHSDGTILPFTGKPYDKVMEKTMGLKFEAKVFTLPDVEVGSIIEYRYATRINDNSVEAPQWFIQGDLYVKSAHFAWYPTNTPIMDSQERPITTISWFPLLPPGVEVVHQTRARAAENEPLGQFYEVTVKDVPPVLKEEYMPPSASYTYRVLFNFTPFHSRDDYWKSEGKDWSKRMNSFADPSSELRKEVEAIAAGATTQDEKLRKIYAAVMALENTAYTREHEQREDKAEGEGKTKTVADVLAHKRGTATQLTELFVGMARAAGMKSYLMLVPDRNQEFFLPEWLSFQQFDDTVAIVNVDGKEMFFDPGSRFCPYGRLAWQHTFVQGLRQTDDGTGFGATVSDGYKSNRTARVANLKMDAQGQVTGTIEMSFDGEPALHWRQAALRGDDESLKRGLRINLESKVPKSLQVKVTTIDGIEDYEKPLKVSYDVTGTLGTPTGKRLVMPADLFEAGSVASFPHATRKSAVYFPYAQIVQDALRINLPQDFTVEAVPTEAQYSFPTRALYNIKVDSTAASFTARRNYVQGDIIYVPADYAALRTFYSQLESKDQESVVVKEVAQAATVLAPAASAATPATK